MLAQLDPFLRNFNPFLRFLGQYKREIAAMLATDTAVTQATDQIGQDRVHYLRLQSPVNAGVARHLSEPAGLVPRQPVLQARHLRPAARRPAGVRQQQLRADRRSRRIPPSPYLAEEFRNRIILYVLNGGNTVAPPCREQGPFTEGGESHARYPHVRTDPQPSP